MVLERIAEVASTTNLKQERTRHVNRMHKLLEETNIKLCSVFADLMCKTGRAILHELAAGEANPEVLADLALLRAPEKRDALVPAMQGRVHASTSSLPVAGAPGHDRHPGASHRAA